MAGDRAYWWCWSKVFPESQEAAVIQFTVDGYSSTPQSVSAGERVGDTGLETQRADSYKDVARISASKCSRDGATTRRWHQLHACP